MHSVSEADVLIKQETLFKGKQVYTLKKAIINVSLLYLMLIFASAYLKVDLFFFMYVLRIQIWDHTENLLFLCKLFETRNKKLKDLKILNLKNMKHYDIKWEEISKIYLS